MGANSREEGGKQITEFSIQFQSVRSRLASFASLACVVSITSLAEPAEYPRRRAPSECSRNIAGYRIRVLQIKKTISFEACGWGRKLRKYLDIKITTTHTLNYLWLVLPIYPLNWEYVAFDSARTLKNCHFKISLLETKFSINGWILLTCYEVNHLFFNRRSFGRHLLPNTFSMLFRRSCICTTCKFNCAVVHRITEDFEVHKRHIKIALRSLPPLDFFSFVFIIVVVMWPLILSVVFRVCPDYCLVLAPVAVCHLLFRPVKLYEIKNLTFRQLKFCLLKRPQRRKVVGENCIKIK